MHLPKEKLAISFNAEKLFEDFPLLLKNMSFVPFGTEIIIVLLVCFTPFAHETNTTRIIFGCSFLFLSLKTQYYCEID